MPDMAAIGALGAARAITLVLSLAVAAAATGDAAAKTRTQKSFRTPASTASALAPALPRPATFFTINAVLAKLDGLSAPAGPLLAAASPSATMSDAARTPALPPAGDEPFNLFAFRAPEGLLWEKWRGLDADIVREAAVIAACRAAPQDCTSQAAVRFIALTDDLRGRAGRDRLEVANGTINAAIRYASDHAQHGVADRWSAPLATFANGLGDCEDYAIVKYVALRDAGIPADDLRLLLVRDAATREDHAVLAARQDGQWLILDNRRAALVADGDTASLRPLFAIDGDGVKLLAAPYVSGNGEIGEADMIPATSEWGAASAGGGSALPLLM
jgi:predicted transglutaminase-like cysteine proteinase